MEEYVYDRAEKRMQRVYGGTEELYHYDAANRSIECTINGKTESYAYDALGRVLRNGQPEYVYDAWGNLEGAKSR